MTPAAIAAAGRLSRTVARLRRAWSWYLVYVRATSVDVPQVRLPRRFGRAPRFGSAAYAVPSARLDLATASFMRWVLGGYGQKSRRNSLGGRANHRLGSASLQRNFGAPIA